MPLSGSQEVYSLAGQDPQGNLTGNKIGLNIPIGIGTTSNYQVIVYGIVLGG